VHDTAEMTRALEDRLLHVEADDEAARMPSDLTLCAAGGFIQDASSGAWSVRIASAHWSSSSTLMRARPGGSSRSAAPRQRPPRRPPGVGGGRGRGVRGSAGPTAARRRRPESRPGIRSAPRPTPRRRSRQGPQRQLDSFFSSGTIVETQEIGLCASGILHLFVTRITSTSIGDVSSEESFDGRGP
jgi:hypothetical protein